MFQFLIGSLESKLQDLLGFIAFWFQFLIGSLESTSHQKLFLFQNAVSIPYR